MRRVFFLLALAILFTHCSDPESIKASDINIVRINQHPFLVDHGKQLVVNLKDASENKMELYIDSGSGCNSHLFETDDYFILIECNGQIYNIDKGSGEIIKGRWTWLEELPDNYVCTYVRTNAIQYSRTTSNPTIMDVYKYKNPDS